MGADAGEEVVEVGPCELPVKTGLLGDPVGSGHRYGHILVCLQRLCGDELSYTSCGVR